MDKKIFTVVLMQSREWGWKRERTSSNKKKKKLVEAIKKTKPKKQQKTSKDAY